MIFNWSNWASKKVKIVAPKIAGIANIKENFAASLLETPSRSANEIVMPERDMPGIIAKAWDMPIKNPLARLNFLFEWYLIPEMYKIHPVKIRAIATLLTESKSRII